MATGMSRREKRERARPHGSAPRSLRATTALRHRAIVLVPGWWLAVAVIAGLFAMHGLGMHGLHFGEASSSMHSASSANVGTSGPDAATAEVSTARMTATGHDADAAVQAEHPPESLGAASLGPATGSPPEPSGGAGLLGMCLALLTFGVLWLRRWTSIRLAWTIPRRAFAGRIAQLPVTARDLSPPLRAELSICRC